MLWCFEGVLIASYFDVLNSVEILPQPSDYQLDPRASGEKAPSFRSAPINDQGNYLVPRCHNLFPG